jgi:hypothetical protein
MDVEFKVFEVRVTHDPLRSATYRLYIASAWDDAIKLANAIREVDMAKDISAFDCKYETRST